MNKRHDYTMKLREIGVLDDIATVAGDDAMMDIVRYFGGQYLYITTTGQTRDAIAAIVGDTLADTLCAHFTGSAIYIPKGDSIDRLQRDDMIRQDFNGRNHAALARKYRLTEIRIRQIVQPRRPEDRPENRGIERSVFDLLEEE